MIRTGIAIGVLGIVGAWGIGMAFDCDHRWLGLLLAVLVASLFGFLAAGCFVQWPRPTREREVPHVPCVTEEEKP
jgi:hypothetical protein